MGIGLGFENTVCCSKPTLARASAGATSAGCRHVPCQSPILGLGIGRYGVFGMAFGVQGGEEVELDSGNWIGV